MRHSFHYLRIGTKNNLSVLKFGKIFYAYKKFLSYLYETVTCITTKGKERKMPGIFVDIKLRKNYSVI